MPKQAKSTIIVKKSKKGTSIEFKKISIKPGELHKTIEESRGGSQLCIRCGIKRTNHPDSPYCQECETRIDNGPLTRVFKKTTDAEYQENLKGVLGPRD